MLRKIISVTLAIFLISQQSIADTRSNAIALFDWAEAQHPKLLTPAGAQVQEIQGFYARYYSDNDVYLVVQGDNVWALGPSLGSDIVYVGKIGPLVTLLDTDISDAILTNSRASCAYYADKLFSAV